MLTIKNKQDFSLGIVFSFLGLLIYFESIDVSFKAKIFTYVIIGIVMLSSFLLIVQSFLRDGRSSTAQFHKEEMVTIGMLILLFGGFIFFGFYVSIFLFIIGLYLYLTTITRRAVITGLVFSIIVTLTVYLMFGLFIGLVFPKGLFF